MKTDEAAEVFISGGGSQEIMKATTKTTTVADDDAAFFFEEAAEAKGEQKQIHDEEADVPPQDNQ